MAETIKGISVVIGAETTGLSKALADVNKQAKDIQSELKQVERLLKLDPSNTELLAQKQKLLSEAVAATKEKLDRLKAAQEQVNEQFKKGEISEAQYRAFQRELIKTEEDLKKFEEQLKKTNPALEAFGAKAKEAGEKLSSVGEKLSGIGSGLSKYVTTPIMAAGAGIVTVGMQFDEAFDKIRIGTGATGKALEGLQEDFRAVAKEVPNSFDEISTAIADYNTRLNLSGPALQELAKQTLNLSRITGTDLATNIENTSRAFQAFNVDAQDYGLLLDYVFRVSQSTGIGIQQLQQNLIKFAPALKQLGLGFADAASLIGFLSKAGVDAEQVMAGLTKAVSKMAKEGITDANEAIKILFDRIKNAPTDLQGTRIALEIFGARAGPALASAVREGKLEYQSLLNAILDSEETINGVADDTDDWAESFTKLKKNVLLALEPISNQLFNAINNLVPVIEKVAGHIANLIQWFQNLSPSAQTAILAIVGITTVLGPFLWGLGQVIGIIGTLTKMLPSMAATFTTVFGIMRTVAAGFFSFFMANPIALVIAGIIAVLVLLYKAWTENWGGIQDKTRAAINWIVEKYNWLKDKLGGIWESIKTTASNAWQGVLAAIKGPVNAIIKGINLLIRALNRIHITVPDWVSKVPGFGWLGGKSFGFDIEEIPTLAAGGIITRPTLALLGEAGPEAVVPLNRIGSMTMPVTINIYESRSPQETAREVKKSLLDILHDRKAVLV